MKRICLFAGYNKLGKTADYVLYYVREMAKLSDVYYWADNALSEEDQKKLGQYAKFVRGQKHGKYDFGSWQELLKTIAPETLKEYDELILCNDSCFGPLWDMAPFFEQASQDPDCDFWGIDAQPYQDACFLPSYFLVFKKKVFLSEAFTSHLASVQAKQCFMDIVFSYEIPFTKKLTAAGFRPKALVNQLQDTPYFCWKKCLLLGMPFVKIKVFTQHEPGAYPAYEYQKILNRYAPHYPNELVTHHLDNLKVRFSAARFLRETIAYYVRELGRKRRGLFRIYINKDARIIRVFGKDLINTEKKIPSIAQLGKE